MLFSFSYSLTSVSTQISSDSDSVQMESCHLSCKWQPAFLCIKYHSWWCKRIMSTPPSLPYPLQRASKISIRESPRKTDFENPEDCQVWDSRLWMSTDVTEAFYKGGKGRTAQKRNATPSLAPFWNEVAIPVFYESLYIFEEARAHPPSNSYSNCSPILSHL